VEQEMGLRLEIGVTFSIERFNILILFILFSELMAQIFTIFWLILREVFWISFKGYDFFFIGSEFNLSFLL
jgi:hypothetical protein